MHIHAKLILVDQSPRGTMFKVKSLVLDEDIWYNCGMINNVMCVGQEIFTLNHSSGAIGYACQDCVIYDNVQDGSSDWASYLQ